MTLPPTRTCPDVQAEIDKLIADGYRLDMIMPADAPSQAMVSRGDEYIRLSLDPKSQIRNPKSQGRAGMEYRDLIPGRLGGRVIASHIRIKGAGPVPDYVHYHKIDFQMIYCKTGWVRVVYEDQGPPFVLNAGDCVLQPPQIRHRVLEASQGAEVIEVSSPAVHETWVDHDIQLPTTPIEPIRDFGGQRFVRYVAGDDRHSDTGFLAATNGLADVRIVSMEKGDIKTMSPETIEFVFVLAGELLRSSTDEVLRSDDSLVIEPEIGGDTTLTSTCASKILNVSLAPDLGHRFFATSIPTDLEP